MDPSSPENNRQPQPLRALVVEDRPDVALGLELSLRHLGHRVEVAHKAKDALQKGPRFQPQLVLLDIGLPDLSGFDVCKEIRSSIWGSQAYIVAVTGRGEPSDLIHTAVSGFDRHVCKPMSLGTLQEIINTVANKLGFPEAGRANGWA
jgi:DNA-binding response OmpR family regulator